MLKFIKLRKAQKTVQSVYEAFTKDLTTVVAEQQKVAEAAMNEQKRLEAELADNSKVQETAANEIRMANNAIANIGNMLLSEYDMSVEELEVEGN